MFNHAEVDHVPLVLRNQAAGVLTLTLNRGERFNPLSSAMIAAIAAELRAIADDPSVRVVVLAAGGKGFCAGHDLSSATSSTSAAA
jgi:enoyl-CoA hydratase/carnithine racemase